MPQSIERVLYTPHRSAAGILAACVDGRLLCMSLYCRGGATVCSMFDLPADVFAERADHSRRARSRPCPSAPLGPVGHGCANPAQQLTVEHLGARVNCANSRRGCSGGHSSAGSRPQRRDAGAAHRSCVRVPRRSTLRCSTRPHTGRQGAASSSRRHRRSGSVGAESELVCAEPLTGLPNAQSVHAI
jgi:hypothetical protein